MSHPAAPAPLRAGPHQREARNDAVSAALLALLALAHGAGALCLLIEGDRTGAGQCAAGALLYLCVALWRSHRM